MKPAQMNLFNQPKPKEEPATGLVKKKPLVSKGDEYTTNCPGCDCLSHEVVTVWKETMKVRCSNCGAEQTVDLPVPVPV